MRQRTYFLFQVASSLLLPPHTLDYLSILEPKNESSFWLTI